MAGAAGLVVASTASLAFGAESGKKQKSALATDGNVMNKVDVLVVGWNDCGDSVRQGGRQDLTPGTEQPTWRNNYDWWCIIHGPVWQASTRCCRW